VNDDAPRGKSDPSETLERVTTEPGMSTRAPGIPRTPAGSPPPDLVGRTLLHFHVVERLGQGGMGVVYKAIDEKLRRPVALKVLNERYVVDDRNREMLLREARHAAAVAHPNIAGIYDVHESEGLAFIAMELVAGKSLRDLIAAGPLELHPALRHAREIALALSAAHDVGVVHRDLKAENVMIADRGHVKVLDFGLAKVAHEPEVIAPPAPPLAFAPTVVQSTDRTAAGHVMGTPAYMSPEQARGQTVDARTDVFAFGVLLYEMLAGLQPFRRRSNDPFEWGGLDSPDWRPSRRLRAVNRAVPRAVEEVVERCLSVDPADRFADGTALLSALDRAARAPRRVWMLGAAVATLAALVAAGLAVRSSGRTSPARPVAAQSPGNAAAEAELAAALQAWRDGASATGLRKAQRATEIEPALAAASLRAALWIELDRLTTIGSVAPDAGHAAYAEAKNHRGGASEYDRTLIDAFEPRFRTPPDPAETERRLHDVAARFPRAGEPLYWIALIRSDAGDVAGAERAAVEAAEAEPGMAPAVLALRAWIASASPPRAGELLDRCIALAPAAADCLGERVRLRGNAGDCPAMEEDAHAWVAADADDAHAYCALTDSLFAQNAPAESVADAARACLQRTRPDEHAIAESAHRIAFAMGAGDFPAAESAARAYRDGLGSSPSVSLAFAVTMALGHAAREAGDRDALREAATTFLDRERAWTPQSLAEAAMPVAVLAFALESGALSRDEFVRERARRLAAVEARFPGAPASERAVVWLYAWAGAVETAEDARAALAALERFPPLVPPEAEKAVRAEMVGKVYALAGDPERAIPYLRRGASTCFMMNSVASALRSRLELANALAQTGRREEARAQYAALLARWGHATPRSVSADEARAKLAALGR
jgi:serine/threonine-protein kinase